MRPPAILAVLGMLLWCVAGVRAESIDDMPPVVVKTVPEAGAADVAPGEVTLKVTFSKDMTDGSWSWSTAWKDSTPEFVGKPQYAADHRTCTVTVRLMPNTTYGFWLNSENFHNFKDAGGRPAVPYLWAFKTEASAAAAAHDNIIPADNPTPHGQPAEYYVMGKVDRPGVYTLTDRAITVKQALAATGMKLGDLKGWTAELVRRRGTDQEKHIQIDLGKLFGDQVPDRYLQANDLLVVHAPVGATTAPAMMPATQPAK